MYSASKDLPNKPKKPPSSLQHTSRENFLWVRNLNFIITVFKPNGSPFLGLFLSLEDSMPEKIYRFAILVRDMRAAQKRYFETRDKARSVPRQGT